MPFAAVGLRAIERDTLNTVLVPIEDRFAQTLLPIIAWHVLSNTRIITDGWRAYQQLANHQWVNHRFNFVDLNDREVHANTIEGTWALVKAKYRPCEEHPMNILRPIYMNTVGIKATMTTHLWTLYFGHGIIHCNLCIHVLYIECVCVYVCLC